MISFAKDQQIISKEEMSELCCIEDGIWN